ncbi:MAG: hypothetical protein M3P38_04625 [Chloroflexota bacterium]|nr:hypothetical protein [Chloroflexota bacterium]
MRRLFPRAMRAGALAVAISLVLAASLIAPASAQSPGIPNGDDPILLPGAQPPPFDELTEELLQQRDIAFITRRTAGDNALSNQQAGAMRAAAAHTAADLRKNGAPAAGPATFTTTWAALGPNPIVQVTRGSGSFSAMSGRIGALVIRPSNGQFILGAAQGGIWLYDAASGKWSPKTDNLPSLSMGALAIAPSNDAIIYAGTGEGALSGDSYFGNGILKSMDGGANWLHVSGDFFEAVSVSRLVVDPANPNHLYASVLRGRGGARRTTPTVHSRFGIWESKDGAVSWTLLKEAKSEFNGATDLELDPRSPQTLYASFWGDAIYKSTNGGASWAPVMNGLPVANYAAHQTRFSIAISHPAGAGATLYAGFDWEDATGDHPSRVFKSTDGGANWVMLPAGVSPDKVEDYCGGQCFYDNVIEVDPTNPNIVFAGGQFDYGIGSGGIFRSDDGGLTWKNLGWDQHPDFHALAFDPSKPAHVLSGSDGGVWYSANRGGRPNASDPLEAVDWQNLNGTVDPNTAGIIARSDLQIAQFTSIATVPTVPLRVWGGTQDNGTLRKTASTNQQWFDVASGDGGQVLVDPANANYVYGTYFGITPYRYTNGGASFFSNQYIRNGINLSDRSDFYIPFTMNKANTNQLFLGTYRLYRTDNAKAASAGDVTWKIISPDLTSGCTGTAPNGARNCTISAIGVGGGQAVYTGSLDGLVYISTDAQVNNDPTWTRLDNGKLPKRPVTQFAVDPSNYRIAYAAYAGFNAASPSRPGHVYKTTDGGQTWTNISGNLPDSPVNSVILDPSYANTLYVGTDVGPFASFDGGVHWTPLGTAFPIVAIWQLDLDPSHRTLAAGTHGRGAFNIQDAVAKPALVLSKVDAGTPVGPSSLVTYTLTVRNIGNAAATGVTITDPVPANTTFASADSGGLNLGGIVTWSGLTIAAGGSITVHFTVSIADAIKNKVKSIVNDGVKVTSSQGMFTTGSPFITPIAPPYAVSVTPATQTDGGKVGTSVSYTVTVKNLGFNTDSYTMSATSGWAVSFFDATCTTPQPTTPSVAAGGTTNVCVKVAIPATVVNGATNTATVTATSVGSPTVSASATIITIAVAADVNTLLVDNDDNAPDVQSYYTTALTSAGVKFSVWDLKTDANLPLNYMKAFKTIVWFTGNSYPGPILPYEAKLKSFLDGGGRLFISGQDLLDQAAGTTAFVHDYLHVTWNGTEAQNDQATVSVHGDAASPVTGVAPAIGVVPLDHTVLGNSFEDQITPNGGALVAFTDDTGAADALSFSGTYKVVFLAFPFEAYGTAAQKTDLVTRVVNFFAAP